MATAAASWTASGADRLVIEVPNRIRDEQFVLRQRGRRGEGDFGPLAAAGDADLGGEAAHPRLGGDVELRVDRRFAGEADVAADQVEAPAGEIVGAAQQVGVAGDARLGHGAGDLETRRAIRCSCRAR